MITTGFRVYTAAASGSRDWDWAATKKEPESKRLLLDQWLVEPSRTGLARVSFELRVMHGSHNGATETSPRFPTLACTVTPVAGDVGFHPFVWVHVDRHPAALFMGV